MRAPCHQGEGSLHLAHADGPPCDARHSSFHLGKNSVRPTFYLTPDGRAGRFNFPNQTCPDPLIALTRRVSAVDNSDSPDSLAHQTLARFTGSIFAHNKKANSDNTDDQVSIVHSATEFLLKLPDISDRHFEIFCFRYLMSKSLNSHCNPPIIGFLSL